ncbi:hypothetical protein [Magnetospirillum sp. UT-4]|uniref:hypothetical protein n=1 Tax=Magnetospirillum sp. UT-4 TaxID=2681467 RepID=UPI00137FEBBA|nr:hypothetical protein [Magnetospirillum sp. UT-4]CAA7623367.1 conserved exported hypothetical protein [Magnetospirillum sp. UT-4]
MLKRLLSLGAAAIAAVASACEEGPASVAGGWRSPATWSTMVHASASGPMLVEVRGDPFGLGREDLAAAAAQAMTNQIIGRALAFTADRDAAPKPQYRVVLAFGPAPDASPDQLCDGSVATARESGEKITVLAVFCDRGQRLASVTGWVARVEGVADKRFRQLLGQMVRELFGSAP